MASSDPELKGRFQIPMWMKNKPTRELETFAASPPAPEDFYIRYPKPETFFGSNRNEQDLNKGLLGGQTNEVSSAAYGVREKDWSRHTQPCQKVLHGIAPINTAANPAVKPKPAGTDDGFKGEGAACGSSVVKVAHQMISSSNLSRGFTVASPEEDASPPDPSEYNLRIRRGSKSLPVTPVHSPPGSPKSRRRNANRYFTPAFEPTDDTATRSWLTMALLGFKKDLQGSTSTLAEEETLESRLQGSTLAESVENLGPAPKSQETHYDASKQSKTVKSAHAFRPKPSELREMNFWSPTSM